MKSSFLKAFHLFLFAGGFIHYKQISANKLSIFHDICEFFCRTIKENFVFMHFVVVAFVSRVRVVSSPSHLQQHLEIYFSVFGSFQFSLFVLVNNPPVS